MDRRRMRGLALVSVIAALLATMVSALAAGPVMERKIVVFQDRVVNEPAREALVHKFGGVVVKHLPLIDGMAVLLPPRVEAQLLRRAEVRRVDDDLTVFAIGRATPAAKPSPPPQPPQTIPWGIARIDAPSAWAYSRGAGVKLAIVDTGIDLDHKDLQANIRGGINTINTRKSANDDNGHGTHVAGIAGAIDNGIGVVGAAPEVSLYAVKVLDRTGSGWLSDVVEGLTWCIDNGMDVVNMSLGSNTSNLSLYQAVLAVYNAGITQVAAAGNNGDGYGTGTGQIIYPAAYPQVIAVTATDSADNLAIFSSFGPEADLAAPGVSIYSTWNDGYYKTISGTSMAAPHVAGVAALRLALHPLETPDQVKAALEDSAEDLGTLGWDPYFGAGLVDALGAVSSP